MHGTLFSRQMVMAEEDIQKLTDAAIKDIDKINADKEKEIMEVK